MICPLECSLLYWGNGISVYVYEEKNAQGVLKNLENVKVKKEIIVNESTESQNLIGFTLVHTRSIGEHFCTIRIPLTGENKFCKIDLSKNLNEILKLAYSKQCIEGKLNHNDVETNMSPEEFNIFKGFIEFTPILNIYWAKMGLPYISAS